MLPELFDYQVVNYNNLTKILENSWYCFNLSEMRTGKSIVSLHLSKNYKRSIVFSYPNVIEHNWELIKQKYNIQNMDLLSINMLRGLKDSNSTNIYLTRTGNDFEETEYWKSIYTDNTLIIIDEFHMIKNDTLSLKAVKSLLQNIKDTNSRVIFMSGTPIDNYLQIENYSYLLNVPVEDLKKLIISNSDNMKPIAPNHDIKYYFCIYNTFSNTLEEKYFKTTNTLNKAYIKTKMADIEYAKIPYFTRLAIMYLQASTNNKIVIGYYFNETYLELKKKLVKFNPFIICGKTNKTARADYIEKFQRNNSEYRLIIANADIISTGIDLADTHGDYPRICLLSPCYKDNQQLLYRFNHVNVKSRLELIYVISDPYEANIFNSNIKKQEIISEFK